jgi:hypothetical protein
MGRQLRFYILPQDANALVAQLRNRFDAKLLVDYSAVYEQFEVDLPFRTKADGDIEVSPSTRFYVAPSSSHIERRHCPKPNWWVIDSDSEGIEFYGCKLKENILSIGRFWYQPNVVKNLQYVSKTSEFLRWAEAVYRYTKKFLRYQPEIAAYVGGEAAKFRELGGRFGPE